MKSTTFRIVSLNILGLSLVTIGLFYHMIQPYFVNDSSYLSYLIAIFMTGNIILSIWDSIKPLDWSVNDYIHWQGENLPFVGILATVIGLLGVVSAMVMAIDSGGTAADLIINCMHAAASGVRTAFGPTAVGLVSYLWSRYLVYFKELD